MPLSFDRWLLESETPNPETYRDDPERGYGEGESQDQAVAMKKAITAAKQDIIKKKGLPAGAAVSTKKLAEKTVRTGTGAYLHRVAIEIV